MNLSFFDISCASLCRSVKNRAGDGDNEFIALNRRCTVSY
jgi:hypothetical protein